MVLEKQGKAGEARGHVVISAHEETLDAEPVSGEFDERPLSRALDAAESQVRVLQGNPVCADFLRASDHDKAWTIGPSEVLMRCCWTASNQLRP